MVERSMLWDGTAGDGGPYGYEHVHDIMFRAMLGSTDNRGVLYNWLNDLVVTGTTSPLSVGTGAAIVYGLFYENDVATTIAVPTPLTGLSRYDYIVVRRTWATQTARIARVAGTAAVVPVAPTLTQTAGTTWEIPLALVLITDSGAITLTDAREYAIYPADWVTIPGIVTTTMIADSTITAANIADRLRYECRGAGQIVPDADNPCTWTNGTPPYYSFAAPPAVNQAWVYFMTPTEYVTGTLTFYLYTGPTVLAAGDVEWKWNLYWGPSTDTGTSLYSHSSIITPDQNGRAILRPHEDAFLKIETGISAGEIFALQIGRNVHGGFDTYASAMALYDVEIRYTADS